MHTFIDINGRRRYVDDDLIKDAFDFLLDWHEDVDLAECELGGCQPILAPEVSKRLDSIIARLNGRP